MINLYLSLVSRSSHARGRVCALSTFVMPLYESPEDGGYERVKAWMQRASVGEKDFVLIPMHKPGHWFLIIADCRIPSTVILTLHDPKYGDRFAHCLKKVELLLRESSKDTSDERRCPNYQYNISYSNNQTNDSDCGVYLCQISKATAFGSDCKFHDKEMKSLRQQMKTELCMLEISPNFSVQRQSNITSSRLTTKKKPSDLITFKNPDASTCWLNSCLQIVIRAMDISETFEVSSELGRIIQNFQRSR